MAPEGIILVAGSLHLDIMLDAPHLPRLDETVTGQKVAYAFGGKGGNQAVAAARMGGRVEMAGAVGRDDFARTLLAGLDTAGVGRRQVRRVDGPSGMSAAIVQPDGGYGAVIVSGANLLFDAATVAFPRGTAALVLQNEIPEPANLTLARRAASAGIRVILNAAPARALSPGLLALVDLLVVNRREAEDLTGLSDPDRSALALKDKVGGRVIVTLGAAGLIAAGRDAIRRPAPRVAVRSTHGAGDAFIGALVAEMVRGAAFPDAVDFAQMAAALHVSTSVEARASIDPAVVRQRLSVQAG